MSRARPPASEPHHLGLRPPGFGRVREGSCPCACPGAQRPSTRRRATPGRPPGPRQTDALGEARARRFVSRATWSSMRSIVSHVRPGRVGVGDVAGTSGSTGAGASAPSRRRAWPAGAGIWRRHRIEVELRRPSTRLAPLASGFGECSTSPPSMEPVARRPPARRPAHEGRRRTALGAAAGRGPRRRVAGTGTRVSPSAMASRGGRRVGWRRDALADGRDRRGFEVGIDRPGPRPSPRRPALRLASKVATAGVDDLGRRHLSHSCRAPARARCGGVPQRTPRGGRHSTKRRRTAPRRRLGLGIGGRRCHEFNRRRTLRALALAARTFHHVLSGSALAARADDQSPRRGRTRVRPPSVLPGR